MDAQIPSNKPWYKKWWVLLIALAVIGFVMNNRSSSKPKTNVNPYQYNTSEKKIHRCGRTWKGERDRVYGVYGDYCCELCYLENYPND
jgi:hypothetical protein